jgi:hypothetical protein
MDEQTYWAIKIVATYPIPIKRPYFQGYYSKEGVAIPLLFTDADRANTWVIQGGNWVERHDWQVWPVAEGDLADFFASSFPQATHVMIDPGYGDEEEQALQPIVQE